MFLIFFFHRLFISSSFLIFRFSISYSPLSFPSADGSDRKRWSGLRRESPFVSLQLSCQAQNGTRSILSFGERKENVPFSAHRMQTGRRGKFCNKFPFLISFICSYVVRLQPSLRRKWELSVISGSIAASGATTAMHAAANKAS